MDASIVRRVAAFVVMTAGACAIDESGLLGPDGSPDVSVPDAPFDVSLDVPRGCTTLDASACVDANLPDGWSYVGVAPGSVACASSDFTSQSFLTGLELEAGACTCGCAPFGSYTCAQTLTYKNSGGCHAFAGTFDAGDEAGCFDVSFGNDNHIEIDLATTTPQSNGAGCDAGVSGNHGFAGTPVTACIPSSCNADYCNEPGFQRCIMAPSPATCPAPFTAKPGFDMGPSSAAVVSCEGCACRVAPSSGKCNATVEAYGDGKCTQDLGFGGAGSCGTAGSGNVNGFFYDPGTPLLGCQVTDGGSGTVRFGASFTVCCLP